MCTLVNLSNSGSTLWQQATNVYFSLQIALCPSYMVVIINQSLVWDATVDNCFWSLLLGATTKTVPDKRALQQQSLRL